MPVSETKICQNCQQDFTIEPEDFEFYEKIQVPPPTFCPECRLQRRLAFSNQRSLYKRKDDATGQIMISMYSSDKPLKVYNHKHWWSDEWDPMAYGKAYDFSKPFFEQFRDLWALVPTVSLVNINNINSDYCNRIKDSKNCYLAYGVIGGEDIIYSFKVNNCKECIDADFIKDSELCYEVIDVNKCNSVFFSSYVEDSYNSTFLFNCRNMSNSFGCMNLRNKSYCIFNTQYSKEEYQKRIHNFDLGSYHNLLEIEKGAQGLFLKYPRKYNFSRNVHNVIGNNVYNAKNCFYCFDIDNAEDSKYLFKNMLRSKNVYDVCYSLHPESLCYEGQSIEGYKILFTSRANGCHDILYCNECYNSHDLFACIGLRHKQYCIFNKQYTKEEYEKLVPRIIQHMNEMPFIDKKGRVYKYGEFFPIELSPFCYNESDAAQYYSLSKERALEKGYSWKDPETKNYQVTITSNQLPDHIKDVKDDILNQTMGCAHEGKCNEHPKQESKDSCRASCTTAFKIIPQELTFYRKMNLPLPRLCPNCRHYQRLKQRNPLKLWKRKCQCNGEKSSNGVYTNTTTHPQHSTNQPCPNEFQTTYSPERPEIVYCESCYNAEVV